MIERYWRGEVIDDRALVDLPRSDQCTAMANRRSPNGMHPVAKRRPKLTLTERMANIQKVDTQPEIKSERSCML